MTDFVRDETLFGPEHVRVYEETGGQRGYRWKNDTTILVLRTVGRKSGEERKTPLIHVEDGGRWIIIASKGGTPEHPDWYLNLEAQPDCEIQVKDEVIPVRAQDAEGEERERLWALAAQAWPDYDEYQRQTDRQIPVVILERR